MMDDLHAMRRLLEPAALVLAVPDLDRAALLAHSAHLGQVLASGSSPEQSTIEKLEADLHRRLLDRIRNRRLLESVRQSQVSLVVNRLFGTYVGVHDQTDTLREHRLVYDHLLLGDAEGSRRALQFHLDADHKRARARLKVLSLFDAPELAPFLLRIH
jgi:DNA-binding GntR family transcriptional regulator